jgi:uncharacterized protein YegP (UPF0339 family)
MYFEIYQERPSLASATVGQWRWRLKGANHEILASGEAYHNKQDCLNVIALLKSTTVSTPVHEA